MTPRDFFYTVAEMRSAQIAYFANRQQNVLRACKKLESIVDQEIARVLSIDKQKGDAI